MQSAIALYIFILGLACGIALLTMSSYRFVSPAWLRLLLMISGCLMICRYATMALFISPDAPYRYWALRHFWFASSIGLTFPSLFAVDQLIRHPAMSPAKLMKLYFPFLLVYLAVMLFGAMKPQPDRIVGWMPHLQSAWQILISSVNAIFVAGFIAICFMLMRKIPSQPIRGALLCLAIGHAYLGIDGLILAFKAWYFKPFLFSELATLLALWYAYDTSASLQRSSV